MFKSGKDIYYHSKYPEVTVPKDISLPNYILKYLKGRPNTPVIVNGGTHREYNSTEIADLIERTASGLSKLGLKKGDIVTILLPNVPEYIFLFHGALLIGATVSLVNPEYTADELKKTVGQLSPKFLITSQEVNDRHGGNMMSILPTINKVVLLTNKPIPSGSESILVSTQTIIENDGVYPIVTCDPVNDIAIIPFSSGTTGLYKGVCLSHCNIIANILQTESCEGPSLLANDVIMGTLPMFHIYGCMLFLGFFLKLGKKLIMCPRFEPNQFLSLIQKYKATIAYIVPPLVLFFAKSPLIDKYDISSLRILLSGAAPLSIELETLFKQRFKDQIYIKQGYGLTETSPVAVISPFALARPGAAGLLVPNITAKIIDTETGNTLGPNLRGELCVRGDNIMVRYFNNEKATKDSIKDGFFHTGDICYVDDDGYFFIVDRVKELIKYKGFQVPPAELEGLLLSHPQIADVCVVGVPDEEGGEVPRAFIVLKPGVTSTDLTADDINKWLNPKISNPKKLRGGIFFISAIPKSATGKLLRKDLKNKL